MLSPRPAACDAVTPVMHSGLETLLALKQIAILLSRQFGMHLPHIAAAP
jgi:hypothetical protein